MVILMSERPIQRISFYMLIPMLTSQVNTELNIATIVFRLTKQHPFELSFLKPLL